MRQQLRFHCTVEQGAGERRLQAVQRWRAKRMRAPPKAVPRTIEGSRRGIAHDVRCLARLAQQDLERRDVGIPLDQRGLLRPKRASAA
ncbi:hypothetical protein LP420_08905 [Massilia sp. B-10]|nr:hypothetical protein LP420_08905 [Massilia sp. B-10]